MANEDLTIAVAGFRTSRIGLAIYLCLCLSTCGLAYLLLRWLPRWHIGLLGRSCPLAECDWVVVENQWNELIKMDIESRSFGRPLSTVFGLSEKSYFQSLEDDVDPLMDELRFIDYRYVRFFFHPVKDKFLLSNGWKDPEWTDVRQVRVGIDSDEKSIREIIFGNNLIDIAQKSVGQLLVDEVSPCELLQFYTCRSLTRHSPRSCIPFTYSRLRVLSFGPWTHITTMPLVFC